MGVKSGIKGFILTALILSAAFFAGGLFPFGYGTVSWCDMNQQAIPLLCDFKDILAGKDGLFLNLHNAGGMDFYGVFFFFLSNPFSFLALFVEKAQIPFLMNVLVLLKLCFSALFASFVFTKLFPKSGGNLSAVLGTVYALCGYGMMFYQNIMWLDIMYLFPVIMLGIYKLTRKNKPLLLTVSLSICIIFNFYISFMVFLFLIFFFGLLALFYRSIERKIYFGLGVCGLSSLLTTAAVLIPCFLQYSGSARGGGIINELKNSDFFAHTDTTLPILLSSGIIFATLIFVLPKFSVKDKDTKFLFTLFCILALPLVIEPVNLMWHTGSYMSFPARYGFITVFVGLMLVAKELENVNSPKKSSITATICLSALSLGVMAFIFAFSKENISILSKYTQTLWGDRSSLKGLIILCIISVLGFFCVLFCYRRKYLTRNVAALLLSVTVAAEGICAVSVYMTPAKEKLSLYNYQSFLTLSDEIDRDGFYRVNTTRKLIDANMTGAAGFNSLSHYTSLNNKDYMLAAKQLGYSGYWMETGNWGGSIISDALLSVGYTVNSNGYDFTAAENPYFLGLGIKAEGSIPENLYHADRLLNLGKAFAEFTNTENAVTRYEPKTTVNCAYYRNEEGSYVIADSYDGSLEYEILVKENQVLYFDCYNGFSNNLVEEINDCFEVYVNGTLFTASYPTQKQNGLLKLGSFKNKTVNITINVLKSAECVSFGIYGVDEQTVKSAVEKSESLNLNYRNGKVTGEVNNVGNYFISLPYSENYKITLNGEKLDYTKAFTGFIAVEIPSRGTLEISRSPKGFTASALISLIGLVLTILIFIFWKTTEKLNNILYNIVYGVFLGVFSAAALGVYIIPAIVNLLNFRI